MVCGQLCGLISMQARVPELQGHKPCKWCNNSSYITYILWSIKVELSDKRLVGENKFYLTMFFVERLSSSQKFSMLCIVKINKSAWNLKHAVSIVAIQSDLLYRVLISEGLLSDVSL